MKRLTALTAAMGLLVLGGLQPTLAADKEAIERAVERGVRHLKTQREYMEQPGGLAPLVGLALLECGVSVEDPAVQTVIKRVYLDSPADEATYSIALAILFLDRLGDSADVPLIESLAVRLLAGQDASGGWSYLCPTNSQPEIRRLTNLVIQRQNQAVRFRPGAGDPRAAPRTVQDLAPEIRAILNQIPRGGGAQGGMTDNSNTQFATLGLWVARKYGLPVDAALERVDARFRTSQNPDGGWGYQSGQRPEPSSATMTCAGLLGLAVGQGVVGAQALEKNPNAPGGRNLAQDRQLSGALAALAGLVDHPLAGRAGGKRPRPVHGRVDGKSFYFLWSLERLAVALGLETIGGKDWYTWATEILIDNQNPDGSWTGNYPGADTCFALLVLKRANLAKDLSRVLRGKVQDQEIVLRAGGVGGSSLRGPNPIRSGLETEKSKNPGSGPKTARNPAPRKDPPASKPPAQDSETTRLARELVQGDKARQERLLEQLRDGKGVVYTEALALAIPQLEGDSRRKARLALAERLTRLKEQSLSNYLKDEDGEIRRAAALACAMKDARGLVPNLIPLLEDPEMQVKRAAHLALRELTGQSLGDNSQAWKDWWSKQNK